jgi:hypothetical protein
VCFPHRYNLICLEASRNNLDTTSGKATANLSFTICNSCHWLGDTKQLLHQFHSQIPNYMPDANETIQRNFFSTDCKTMVAKSGGRVVCELGG